MNSYMKRVYSLEEFSLLVICLNFIWIDAVRVRSLSHNRSYLVGWNGRQASLLFICKSAGGLDGEQTNCKCKREAKTVLCNI